MLAVGAVFAAAFSYAQNAPAAAPVAPAPTLTFLTPVQQGAVLAMNADRKSTRLNSSHT